MEEPRERNSVIGVEFTPAEAVEVVEADTGVHVSPAGQTGVGTAGAAAAYVEALPVVKVRSVVGALVPEAVERILKW